MNILFFSFSLSSPTSFSFGSFQWTKYQFWRLRRCRCVKRSTGNLAAPTTPAPNATTRLSATECSKKHTKMKERRMTEGAMCFSCVPEPTSPSPTLHYTRFLHTHKDTRSCTQALFSHSQSHMSLSYIQTERRRDRKTHLDTGKGRFHFCMQNFSRVPPFPASLDPHQSMYRLTISSHSSLPWLIQCVVYTVCVYVHRTKQNLRQGESHIQSEETDEQAIMRVYLPFTILTLSLLLKRCEWSESKEKERMSRKKGTWKEKEKRGIHQKGDLLTSKSLKKKEVFQWCVARTDSMFRRDSHTDRDMSLSKGNRVLHE